jgi:hypothetical protein
MILFDSSIKTSSSDMSIFSILVKQHFPMSMSPVPFEEIFHPEHMKNPAYAKYPMTIQTNTA